MNSSSGFDPTFLVGYVLCERKTSVASSCLHYTRASRYCSIRSMQISSANPSQKHRDWSCHFEQSVGKGGVGRLSSVVSRWRSISVKEALEQERGARSLVSNHRGERKRSLGSMSHVAFGFADVSLPGCPLLSQPSFGPVISLMRANSKGPEH